MTEIWITEARKHLNTMDERLKTEKVIFVRRHQRPAFAFVDLEYLTAIQDAIEIDWEGES